MILIAGRSGAGKDHLARELKKEFGLKQVLSYTTRPPRKPDEDTHIFISRDEVDNYPDKIAPAIVKGEFYFATKKQVEECDVYIVEPNGVADLLANCPDVPFVICYLRADREERKSRAIARASDKEKEAEIFENRDADEDTRFAQFEHLIDKLSVPGEAADRFFAAHPNIKAVFNKKNDYTPTCLTDIASELVAVNAGRVV